MGMVQSQIKAAIFDIGMVLLRFDFSLTVKKVRGRCKVGDEEISRLFWGSGLVKAYDRGEVTTSEFGIRGAKLIGFDGDPEELISAWSDIFEHNQCMIERVGRWKARGMALYLLSNTCESHVNFFTAKYDFFELFDGRVYSYKEGCAKPEPAIYQTLLDRFGLQASSTLMIDDRLENIEAARNLGIKGLLYEEDKALEAQLLRLGLD